MKALLIGPEGAGKTTLCYRLSGREAPVRPTQMFRRIGALLDTPGIYLANPDFYHALIVGAQQADAVLLAVAPDCATDCVPPGFSQCFSRPVYGVLTKCDLPDRGRAESVLLSAGVRAAPFQVSCRTGEGLPALARWLARPPERRR